MSQAVVAFRRLFDAVQRMDREACVKAFAKDGVMHTPCLPSAFPRVRTGSQDLAQVYDFLFTAVFKSFAWVELEVHATDDPSLAFARARSRAELTDGRTYSNEYACYARVRDGLITEYTEFFDTERAIEAFKHLQ